MHQAAMADATVARQSRIILPPRLPNNITARQTRLAVVVRIGLPRPF
jgi:hypothetical protein